MFTENICIWAVIGENKKNKQVIVNEFLTNFKERLNDNLKIFERFEIILEIFPPRSDLSKI